MKEFEVGYEYRLDYVEEYREENNMGEWELNDEINNCFYEVMTEGKYNFIDSYSDTFSAWYSQCFYQIFIVETELTKVQIEKELNHIIDKYDFIERIIVDEREETEEEI